MATSLTRTLIEAHLAEGASRARSLGSGAEVELRVDQVLMGADAASLVFRYFGATGRTRGMVETALACAEGAPPGLSFEAGEVLQHAQAAARRYGVQFSRAGNGRAHHVHAAGFAAPGRTLLACAAGAASAGALGSLVFEASEIEMAAVLAGAMHPITTPQLWAVHLSGSLPPWVDVHDVMRALAERMPAHGATGAVLEYGGPGVAALSLDSRLTAARAGVALGASMSLFPSDAETRRWLQARGREPDWKPLAGEPEGEAVRVVELHLDALEPMIARDGRPGATSLREAVGTPVARVVLGADAGLEDLLRLAAVARGRTVAPGVELVVIPGSRQIRDQAAALGALADLVAAGARLADREARLARAPAAGAAILCGATSHAGGGARAVYRIGPAAAMASALAGVIADPRELPLAPGASGGDVPLAPHDGWVVKPATTPGVGVDARADGMGPLPQLPPITGSLRGVVLIRLADRVDSAAVLSGGPKVQRFKADFAALAGHLFGGVDRGFAARALAHGGGFVIAGAEYGLGLSTPHAVLALVQLGVRAILARSFAREARAELVRHGILALRFASGVEPDGLAPGDELEIPGLPEVLEPSRPLTVRDLTRGSQHILHHDMDRREIEMVRAGGLMRVAAPAVVGA